VEQRETEIKLRVKRPSLLKTRLRDAGATLLKRRHFEDNIVFDYRDGRIRRSGSLLRLRLADGEATLTFKGRSRILKSTKARLELETQVSDWKTALKILTCLGLRCAFRYEKFRTIFHKDATLISLDETPIGDYIEIEGRPEAVRRLARQLGYQREDFITSTYVDLFNRYKAENRISTRNMIFGIRA